MSLIRPSRTNPARTFKLRRLLNRCIKTRRALLARDPMQATTTTDFVGLEVLESRIMCSASGSIEALSLSPAPPSAPSTPRSVSMQLPHLSSSEDLDHHEDEDHHDDENHLENRSNDDVPHPDDPEKQQEHLALLNLVPRSQATHVAVSRGPWSSPETWLDMDGDQIGDIPDNGAKVLIPEGVRVNYNMVANAPLDTVRVDGTLHFRHDVNTMMIVDTLVVDTTGILEIGTKENPIAADVFAMVLITDQGPIDTEWDPLLLSRGVISHGQTQINGSYKTPYVAIENNLYAGDTELVLSQVPTDWRVGDRLVITNSQRNGERDEQVTIRAIDGNQVTITRLNYGHVAPEGLSMYAANLVRNVVVLSQNTSDVSRRGHVMFMHSVHVEVNNAGFYGLGRTDKDQRVTDPTLDSQGHLIPSTGVNPRGRYAVHFHRTGTASQDIPAMITASVVVDSPGWGFVNHDSHVVMEDNVSYDSLGAGFVTELGNETGAFRRNLAIRSVGSGESFENRADIFDFGHSGHGFWFQGPGVEVEDNIVAGSRHVGFMYYTRSSPVDFDAANLLDPSIAGGEDTISVSDVPIRLFRGNTAFGVKNGFQTWFHMLNATHDGRSVIEDFTVWGTRSHGVAIPYTAHTNLINVTAINNVDNPRWTAINSNTHTDNIIYDNVRLEGWEVGIKTATHGYNMIHDGYFRNVKDILIPHAWRNDRVIEVTGNPRYARLSPEVLGDETKWIFFVDDQLNVKNQDIASLFATDTIMVNVPGFRNTQIFYPQQHPSYVLFKADQASDDIPAELIGKTNQQIWNEYGLALSGVNLSLWTEPYNSEQVNGWVGRRLPMVSELEMRSRTYTNELEDYTLIYVDPDGNWIRDDMTVNLNPGWNLITRTVGDMNRTFFVYGDNTDPYFQPNGATPQAINPNRLSSGIEIYGYIYDDGNGRRSYETEISGDVLESLPVLTDANGDQYIEVTLSYGDWAGNRGETIWRLTLDPNI